MGCCWHPMCKWRTQENSSKKVLDDVVTSCATAVWWGVVHWQNFDPPHCTRWQCPVSECVSSGNQPRVAHPAKKWFGWCCWLLIFQITQSPKPCETWFHIFHQRREVCPNNWVCPLMMRCEVCCKMKIMSYFFTGCFAIVCSWWSHCVKCPAVCVRVCVCPYSVL